MKWEPSGEGFTRYHRGSKVAGTLTVAPSRSIPGAWIGRGPKGDLLTPRGAWGRSLDEQNRTAWATAEVAMVEIDDRFKETA